MGDIERDREIRCDFFLNVRALYRGARGFILGVAAQKRPVAYDTFVRAGRRQPRGVHGTYPFVRVLAAAIHRQSPGAAGVRPQARVVRVVSLWAYDFPVFLGNVGLV